MFSTRGPMSTQMPFLENRINPHEDFQRTQIMGAVQENIKYGELDFFTQDHKNTVDKFLNDIMIKIDLRSLYRIVDTCYYSKLMPYCPVLLENMHQEKDQKFHIQVWDNHGNLIYEPPQMFKEKPVSWCVTYEFFVYRPQSSDQLQGQDCYYIVNLNKSNETSIINVWGHDRLGGINTPIIGFCNRCLFISNQSQIYVLNTVGLDKNVVSNHFINGNRNEYEINLGKVKNHGFAMKAQQIEEKKQDQPVKKFLQKDSKYLIIACETSDYQIDFATLTFFPDQLSHKLSQISQMILRKSPIVPDSVKKFRMVYDEDQFCFAAALTEMGICELYWNYNRYKDGHVIPNVTYTDFEINFNAIYGIRDSRDSEDRVVTSLVSVPFNQQGKICVSDSKTLELEGDESIEEALERLSQEKCSNLSNIYQSFCLIQTFVMVAHHKKVFIFDILQSKLVKTIECQQRILKLFPNKKPKPSKQREIGVIFDDGSFSVISQSEEQGINSQDWELKDLKNVKTNGVPIKVFFDNYEDSEILFVLSYNKTDHDNKPYHLEVYARRALIETPGLFQANSSQIIMVGLQHTKENSIIILLDKTNNRLIVVEYDQEKKPPLIQLRSIGIQQNQELYNDPPHSAITEDIDKKFFLFGQNNMYVINQENQLSDASVTVIPDVNIINAKFIDMEFCYSIVKSGDAAKGGLKIFRLKNLDEESGKPLFLEVEPSHEGPKNHIELNIDSQRLIYLRDNYEIHIIPPLHRSTINFFGMLSRDKYLVTRRNKDKFFALDVFNKISTWSMATGKLITVNQAKIIFENQFVNVDFSDYNVFGFDSKRSDNTYVREWNHPFSLIYNYKKEEKNFDKSNNKQGYSEIQGCQTFEEQMMPKIKARRFKFIQIVDQDHVHEKIDFVHNCFSDDLTQKLHISKDAEIMIERLENHRVLIYTRNADNKNNAWKFEKTFDNFPHDVFTQTKSSLYLFTPDLKRFACLNTNKDKIIFNKTLESEIDDDFLPNINIRNLMLKSEMNSKIDIFKRFSWVDNNRFLLCSSQGFEKLYQIDDNLNIIKDIGSSQIPAFFECNDAIHLYTDNSPLDLRFVKRRLFRKHQQLKRQRYLIHPEINQIPIETLIGVDFNINDKGKLGKYVIDMPFTWILWKITEEIETGNLELLQQMDDETLQVLCLNIMPQCQTFMHKLKDQNEAFYEILQRIPCQTPTFEMPFIKDKYEKTRLHYCIDEKGKDLKTAGRLIIYLSNANLDHHSREIVDVLPKLIREDLKTLTYYFQKRSIPNAYLHEINRGEIKYLKSYFPVSMMSACIWHDFELMKEQLFVEESKQTLGNITEVELFFIDLPGYQSMASPNFLEFFRALKDTSNIQLFELVPIRALIEFHWAEAKNYTLLMLGAPFVVYLLSFIIYTNLVDDLNFSEASVLSYMLWIVNILVLFAFSAYFIWREITQIMISRFSYFKDLWNYVDFTPPLVVLIIAFINIIGINTKWESVFKSIGSLFMWLKMLYFLRIYKKTGYQIRMISKVLQGMKTFLFVLFVTILAVTDAQLSIKKKEDMKGVTGFWPYTVFKINQFFNTVYNTYQMILGNGEDLETQEGFDTFGKLLIIFSTLLLMIVMLNLLIAIIGDIFNNVQENQLNEYYQEKATIIYENQYLIPEEVKQQKAFAPGNLLLLCQRAGYDIQEGEDDQMQRSEDKRNQELLQQIKEIMESKLRSSDQQEVVEEGQEQESVINPLLQASARRILTESALRQQSFLR